MSTENKDNKVNTSAAKKDIMQPTPHRNFNLNHLKFLEMENVKFYSENIHTTGNQSKKNNLLPRTTSHRAPNPSKARERKRLVEERRAKFGLIMNVKNFSKIKEEDEDKEQDHEEKGFNDTQDSSKENNSKDIEINNQKINKDNASISRVSNPVSQIIERNDSFNFDDSISERGEDEDKLSNDSLEF